ncbi:MAG: class I SAM-dependent methyltransferase [Thermomicrobiales bacterium]|nr:class I SAM-dependent methyltransferase [Thermomicrobiales bacterium]
MIALSPAASQPTDFDAIAEIYDGVFPTHVQEHYLQRRLRYIRQHAPAARALDVGAGTGLLAERLAEAGTDVVALDPFPGMLEQLRRRRPDIETVVAHGEAIPLPDNHFDLAYSVAVMHHIAGPDKVRRTLAEMVRVTRPGGHILIWDHNPRNPYWPNLMRRVPQDVGSERMAPMEELLVGLMAAGASIERAERLGMMPEFMPRALLPVAALLERAIEATPGLRSYCAHNVVLARKA